MQYLWVYLIDMWSRRSEFTLFIFSSWLDKHFYFYKQKVDDFLDFWPSINDFDLKYLHFLNRIRPAVFCVCSISFSSTFWRFKTKISILLFEKSPENCLKWHVFALIGWSKFFFKNPAVLIFLFFGYLTTCKVSGKSLAPFLRKSRKTIILTTFLDFLDDPKFFWIIRLRHFFPFINV